MRLAWLRFDTWRAGKWRDYPHRTATAASLRASNGKPFFVER